jgi:hypothetical protein
VMRDKKIERKLFQFKGVPGKMNITELRYSWLKPEQMKHRRITEEIWMQILIWWYYINVNILASGNLMM